MYINDLSSCNLIGLSSSLAIAIGENLSSDELAIVAAFFTSFADNLTLISAKKSISESNKNNSN